MRKRQNQIPSLLLVLLEVFHESVSRRICRSLFWTGKSYQALDHALWKAILVDRSKSDTVTDTFGPKKQVTASFMAQSTSSFLEMPLQSGTHMKMMKQLTRVTTKIMSFKRICALCEYTFNEKSSKNIWKFFI